MVAPAYKLTNYTGTNDPAGDILTLVEAQLTLAGWVFIEEVPFVQTAINRLMRVWKNPGTMNLSGADFYVGFVKDAVAGTRLAMRAFEGWDAVGKNILRPCIQGSSTATPVGSGWTSIAYGAGVYVAVGPNGAAASSPDGITWTARVLPVTATLTTAANWTSVTYGGGLFVAVASGTAIAATSPDGITWTARVLPSVATWNVIVYGGGLFVAFCTSGAISATSPDGITWTSRAAPSSVNFIAAAYGAGVFVVIVGGSSTAYSSPDGIAWTTRTLPASTFGSITFGSGQFVTVGATGAVATSPNGTTSWTSRVMPGSSLTWNSIAYGSGMFVAVGNGSVIWASSTDGITWTARTGMGMNAIVCYGSAFVAIGATTSGAASSADGITWVQRWISAGPYHAGAGNWLLNGTSTPLIVDTVTSTALLTGTNYDVGVLASKSYVTVGVALNGTPTWVFQWVLGLCSPGHVEGSTVFPALMALDAVAVTGSASSGVSRAVRSLANNSAFSVAAGPESILLGTTASKEGTSQVQRASRVALGGNGALSGFAGGGGYRGLLLDAVTIAPVVKVGDTITIGGVVYTALASGPPGVSNFVVTGLPSYYFNTVAGS